MLSPFAFPPRAWQPHFMLRPFRYVFFEMIPSFILGNLVFISILLMFQALRLTEFILIHGVDVRAILNIVLYLSISFLPAILPMSLLFSILMTYGRLSNDSEIIAMKSVGIPMRWIVAPAIAFGLIVTAIAAKTSFEIGPWGNRQFEILVNDIGSKKAAVTIREGTFSEGFFDLVIYANKVDSQTGFLEKVFIYDEKRNSLPVTIVAKTGQILSDPSAPGHYALLRLKDGSIHRQSEAHTKIDFQSYDIELTRPMKVSNKKKSLQSLTLNEINETLKNPNLKKKKQLKLKTEYHKRWAISFACAVFALLGAGFGAVSNRRSGKSSGLILSIALIVGYWILYVSLENMARTGQAPIAAAVWTPNAIFLIAALRAIYTNAK